MEKQRIKEAIVVEGKDDAANLARFFDAEFIITHGFGLNEKISYRIKQAAKTEGVIIFTDPDFAGNGIRERLSELLLGEEYLVKHAYLSRMEATKKGNVGVENAEEEALVNAIMAAKPTVNSDNMLYCPEDMIALGLSGKANSKGLRAAVAEHFRIACGNAKVLLRQLNKYRIPREELTEFIRRFGSENAKIDK